MVKTALVVEDSTTDMYVLSKFLERLDIKTIATATNEIDAIIQYKKHLPSVACIDINLSPGSGLSVAKSIKKEFPNSCVVLVTGEDRMKRLDEALRARVDGYIMKPIIERQLRDIFETLKLIEVS